MTIVVVGGSFRIDFTSGVDVALILASLLPLLNTFLNMMDLMGVTLAEMAWRSLPWL